MNIGQIPTVLLDNTARSQHHAGRDLISLLLTVKIDANSDVFRNMPPQIVLSIVDMGLGLPKDLRTSLGRTLAPSRHGGHGIGLYPVSTTVRHLGGTVVLRPNPPQGAIAELRLPVSGPMECAVVPIIGAPTLFTQRDGLTQPRARTAPEDTVQQSVLFLILNGDDVFAQTLACAPTRRGFIPQIAHTGDEALILTHQARFLYIIAGLHLAASDKGLIPHDGMDSDLCWIAPLCQTLPKACMLIPTDYASIATAVQAVRLGVDECLAKPANVDSILLALQVGISGAVTEQTMENPASLSVTRLEQERIQRVLTEHGGNIPATARVLNIHRRTLQRRLGERPIAKRTPAV